MAALPAGSPQAKLVVVNRGNLGYGENKKDPPYLREKRHGREQETVIRKLHGDVAETR